ncbi:efflux RND transporter permease subunit [bacterium]|nr:efflux RND transporter permease subunit [bacterium]
MIRFFASHPTAANLLMLIIIITGIIGIPSLRRETFPEFEADQVRVSVSYSGASAAEMEEAVGQPIEDAISSINYVEEIKAESKEGNTNVTIEMQEDGDITEFYNDIRTAVEAITTFPEGANDPVITEMNRTSHVVAIAVSGPMSVQHLKEYCESLKRKLKQLPEVSIVEISGFSDRQIQIRVKANKLMQYGISINDIATAIASQSLDIPAGSIDSDEQEMLIRFADKRRAVEEFKDIVIVSGSSGAEIKLGDISTIVDAFELDESKTIFNDERAAYISIVKSKEEDSLIIYDAVKKYLEKERELAPDGVKLTLTYDMASIIRDRLELVFMNGWQGLILVFIAMYIFFNFRTAFWVAMGLPISFLGAFFLMAQIGYTLNIMTTLALLLSIGILMDDAIVIAENIAVYLQKGENAVEAVIKGTLEVKNGVIASFLTTACVFLPLAFLEGRIGKVLLVVPIILLFVLSISLIEAFLILPHHLGHAFKNRPFQTSNRIRNKVESIISFIRERILGRIVDAAVNRRYLTVGIVIMVFITSIALLAGGRLKFIGFPESEGDVIEAKILLPQGTPLNKTEVVVETILAALNKVDEKLTPLQKQGQKLVQNIRISYGQNSDSNESGPHLATIAVDLLENGLRNNTTQEITSMWRKETGSITDVISINYGESQRGPGGTPIQIQFQADDLDELKQSSLELMTWLSQFDGVFDVFDDMRPGKPEIVMKLKKGATILGVTANSIASQVRSAFLGNTVNEIQVGQESYEVSVQLDPQDKDNLQDLELFHVYSGDGTGIPVTSVVDFERKRGFARIVRIDGIRTLTLAGNVNSSITNSSEVISKMKADFLPEFKKNHPGVSVKIRGSEERTAKTSGSMMKMFLVGIIGVFILLSFQFKSYSEPFVIMMAIPFALIGVIWGHYIMGISLSMPSLLGFVSLSGIVVNDSILLVEFIKKRRMEGIDPMTAAKTASRQRFRAVFLTSVTTIFGLIPLLSETSLQAQMLIPIAVSIAFGLMASTLLILVVIPCFYAIADDFGLTATVETIPAEVKTI